MLQLDIENGGTLLLTGDLYHLTEARELRAVPVFNTDEAETLRSMDKFEALAQDTKARVIIQHSIKDFEGLPILQKHWLLGQMPSRYPIRLCRQLDV